MISDLHVLDLASCTWSQPLATLLAQPAVEPHATRHAHSILPLAAPAAAAGAEVLVLFGGFSKFGFSSSWLSLLHLGQPPATPSPKA